VCASALQLIADAFVALLELVEQFLDSGADLFDRLFGVIAEALELFLDFDPDVFEVRPLLLDLGFRQLQLHAQLTAGFD
jgi:hypothetical protein